MLTFPLRVCSWTQGCLRSSCMEIHSHILRVIILNLVWRHVSYMNIAYLKVWPRTKKHTKRTKKVLQNTPFLASICRFTLIKAFEILQFFVVFHKISAACSLQPRHRMPFLFVSQTCLTNRSLGRFPWNISGVTPSPKKGGSLTHKIAIWSGWLCL